jgi:hypothetical protein
MIASVACLQTCLHTWFSACDIGRGGGPTNRLRAQGPLLASLFTSFVTRHRTALLPGRLP